MSDYHSHTYKKMPVEDLRSGMYVAKLDRDWLETPFLMQGFLVSDREDIQVIAQYAETVWVDPARSTAPILANGGYEDQSDELVHEAHEHPVEVEVQKVQQTYVDARNNTAEQQAAVRNGAPVDCQSAKATVEECVSSILRNPDALIWMAKIREESAYTAEHSLNVCVLAVAFGRDLGFNKEELELLGLCGLLHDIGKMRVPLDILEKPGKLTNKEMNMMKAHTVHGRNLLMESKNIDPRVIDVAYSHHERVDGVGYPRKINAKYVDVFTRIITIVDAYDAMTAERCYSKARATTDALKIIYLERGKQFDEDLAVKFIKVIGIFPVGSVVELYSGDVGIVIEGNTTLRHLPRVVLVLSDNKEKRRPYKMINLALIAEGNLDRRYLIKKVHPDGAFGVTLRAYQEEGIMLNF